MSTIKSSSEDLTLNADGAGNDVVIQSNGTTKAIVTAEGLLGIGTASPTEELHISGSSDVRIALENTANRRYDIVSGDSGEFKIWDTAVGERMRIDTSNNFKFDSGYGSVTTAYGCRAWINFNGTGVVAIRGSGNVSSITDNGVGDYTINFATAMPDANYAPTFGVPIATDNTRGAIGVKGGYNSAVTLKTTTQLRISGGSSASNNVYDFIELYASIFR